MDERLQIFERVTKSSIYQNRSSREINSSRLSMKLGCGTAFATVWCLGAVSMTIFVFLAGGGFFAFILGIMPCVGIGLLVYLIRKINRYIAAETQAIPAIVVSKHIGRNVRNSLQKITLEFENGERKELEIANDREAALIGAGDAGVAFIKADFLLAFDRVP